MLDIKFRVVEGRVDFGAVQGQGTPGFQLGS